MTLKHHSFLLLAALTIATCGLSESRGIETISKQSVGGKTILDNPNVRRAIINGILAKQGTSPAKIQEIINAANGNLQQAVNGINAELQEDVVKLDGDAIKINPEGLKSLLKKSLDAVIAAGAPKASPVVAALQSSVSEQLAAESAQFSAAVAKATIPLDVAHQLVRRKRSLQPKDLISDITGVISNIVIDIIGQQLSSVLVGILDSLKDYISSLLIINAPGNPIGDFLAGIFNFVIKGLLQVITTVEQSVSPTLQTAAIDVELKQARDLSDIIGGVEDGVGNVVDGVEDGVGSVVDGVEDGVQGVIDSVGDAVSDASDAVNDVISSGGGLLEGILGPIFDLLGSLLAPVSSLIQNVINAIVALLEQLLGGYGTTLSTILGPLIEVIISSLLVIAATS